MVARPNLTVLSVMMSKMAKYGTCMVPYMPRKLACAKASLMLLKHSNTTTAFLLYPTVYSFCLLKTIRILDVLCDNAIPKKKDAAYSTSW